jgi:hypothetical protein
MVATRILKENRKHIYIYIYIPKLWGMTPNDECCAEFRSPAPVWIARPAKMLENGICYGVSSEKINPIIFWWSACQKKYPVNRRYRTKVCLHIWCVLVCSLPHSPIVTLRGASELTSSFLKFAINSILYNRQVFPKQSFTSAMRFGCEVHVTRDEWLEKYLTKFFGQVRIVFACLC